MEENEKKMERTKRDAVLDRLRNKYPDNQFADDEEIYGKIDEDYNGYEDQIAKQREAEKGIVDLFSSNPKSAEFMMAWKSGKDPLVELVRMYGDELKDALDNPDDKAKMDALADANAEYVERVAKTKELEDSYQKNIAESLALVDEVQSEKGLSDDKMDAAMNFLFEVVSNGIIGKFDRNAIDFALKAMNYDNAVAEAQMEGEVAGRNEKITEKLRKAKSDDGVPNLGGKNSVAPNLRRNTSLFDLANEAK